MEIQTIPNNIKKRLLIHEDAILQIVGLKKIKSKKKD